jgi:hypothetical protein
MADRVREIMNPELFHLRPGDSAEDAPAQDSEALQRQLDCPRCPRASVQL